jgi:L-asparagine transporter-like permease
LVATSACNSGIFSNGRVLYNLALRKDTPTFLTKTSLSKVPINAILISSAFVSIGVIVNFFIPEKAFLFLANITITLTIFTWSVIVVVQMKHRHFLSKEEIANLKYPMPFYPYSNILIFIILAMSSVSL